jgi:hypothetical protein
MWQEKVSSDIARALGLDVPEIRVGTIEGQTTESVISIAYGKESIDLRLLSERFADRYKSPLVQKAVRKASGLLVLHTWLGTGDLKDDHLVVAEHEDGSWSVAAIDFAQALGWGSDGGVVTHAGGPPALIANVDQVAIEAAMRAVEGCDEAKLSGILGPIPASILDQANKSRIISGLGLRRPNVRPAIVKVGWLK